MLVCSVVEKLSDDRTSHAHTRHVVPGAAWQWKLKSDRKNIFTSRLKDTFMNGGRSSCS